MLIINYRKTSKASYKKNEQNLSSNNCKTLFSDNNIDVLTYGINKYSSYYKNEVFFLLIDGYCFYKNRLLGCEDLYEQYLKNGFDFVKHSKGSFNIILYLVQSKSLIIKTDKYGSRMLFYTDQKKSFHLASRLLDLIKHSNIKPRISDLARQEYLFFRFFIQNSKTLFEDLLIFPTDKSVHLKGANVNWHQYPMPMFNFSRKKANSPNVFPDIWESAFDSLIQLCGSEHFLVPLSAGLDSRAILAEFARRGLQKKVLAVTFSHPNSFELNIARKVAKKLQVEHQVIHWSQDDLIHYNDFDKDTLNTEGMIMATPYIPVKKYESLSDISNILWSGFSGDPLMGSHTLKEESINQKSNLLAICFEKYKSLSKDEMRLLNLDFNIKALKNEINSTVKYFEHLNIIEGFDSWYMQNRNRYTTQCGVSACRNLFEFIYPFLFVTDYALLSRLEGRYNRSDYLEHVKKLYTSAFKIPSSNHWNTYQRGSEKFGYLMNKNLLKYSFYYKNVPNKSYKFNYDHLVQGSKKYRSKILEHIDSLGNEKIVTSIDTFDKYMKQGKLSYSFIDCVFSYHVVHSAFIKN